MIPLSLFLIAWIAFLVLYGIMSLLAIMQITRFGVAGAGTWLSVLLFTVVAFVIIFASGWYMLGVDWSQSVDLFGWLAGASAYRV